MMPLWLLAVLLVWIGLSVVGVALLLVATGQPHEDDEWRYSVND